MLRTAHKLSSKKWRSEDIQVEENAEFSKLPLSARVLKGLKRAGFRRPSPIQLKSIPVGRGGVDLMIQSKSGTGKTCVFCTIALEKLLPVNELQIIVVAPTREIAIQIEQVFLSIGCTTPNLDCKSFIGGRSIAEDVEKLDECKIAIGTPGRLKHLAELSYLRLDTVTLFVLDEADKLVHRSFLPEINFLCQNLPKNKQLQIITASATYPNQFVATMKKFMGKNVVHVSTCENELNLKGIRQFCKLLPSQLEVTENFHRKIKVLLELLRDLRYTQCILFVNCLDDVRTVEEHLKKKNIVSAGLSSVDPQERRLETMEQLRKYQIKILVTTDLAARGIDIEKVDLVINIGIPKEYETYLHRIGRAGRFGSIGISISLVSGRKEEKRLLSFIHQENMKVYSLPNPLPYNLFAYEVGEKDILSFKYAIEESNPDSAQPDQLNNDEFPAEDLRSSSTEQLSDVISETIVPETGESIEKCDPLPSDTLDHEISSDEFANAETCRSPQNSPDKRNSVEVKESKNEEFVTCKVNQSFSGDERENPESISITDSVSNSINEDHNYSRKIPGDGGIKSQGSAVDLPKHSENGYIEDGSALDVKYSIKINASENLLAERNTSISIPELEEQCSSIISGSSFENETVSDFSIENIDLNNFINSSNDMAASLEWVRDGPEINLTLISSFLENSKILTCIQDQEMERTSSECGEPSNGTINSMKQELETPSDLSENIVSNTHTKNSEKHQVENLHDISLSEITSIVDLEIENEQQSSEQKSFDETNHNDQQQVVIRAKTKKYTKNNALKCNDDTNTGEDDLSNQNKPLTKLSTEITTSSEIVIPEVKYFHEEYDDESLSVSDEETDNSSEMESSTSCEEENNLSPESEETSCSSPERRSENEESSVSEDEDTSHENATKYISERKAIRSNKNFISKVNDVEKKHRAIGQLLEDRKHSLKKKHRKNCPLYQNNCNSKTKRSSTEHLSNRTNKHLDASVQRQQMMNVGNDEKLKLECNSSNSHMLKSKLCKKCQRLSETVAENHHHRQFHNHCCSKYSKALHKKKAMLHPLTSENVRSQGEMHLECRKDASDCHNKAHHQFEGSGHQICYPPIVIRIGSEVNSCCSHSVDRFCSENQSLPSCCHERVINIHLIPCSHQPQHTSRSHSPNSNHTYQVSQSGRKCRNFSEDPKVKEDHHAQELHSHSENFSKTEPKLQCRGGHHANYGAFLHEHLLANLGMQ